MVKIITPYFIAEQINLLIMERRQLTRAEQNEFHNIRIEISDRLRVNPKDDSAEIKDLLEKFNFYKSIDIFEQELVDFASDIEQFTLDAIKELRSHIIKSLKAETIKRLDEQLDKIDNIDEKLLNLQYLVYKLEENKN